MRVAARAAASRRLLLNEEAGTLNDPNPICQFCEVAVSYVKVSLLCFLCPWNALRAWSCLPYPPSSTPALLRTN